MRIPLCLTQFRSLSLLAGLVLLAPAAALAQGNLPTADTSRPPPWTDASLAQAPTAPLVYLGMVPQTSLADAAPSATSWRDSHSAVASFPRGHADIVAWEARNIVQPGAAAPPPSPVPATSHGGHGHHRAHAAGDKAQASPHEGHGPKPHDTQTAAPMHRHGHTDHHPSGSRP